MQSASKECSFAQAGDVDFCLAGGIRKWATSLYVTFSFMFKHSLHPEPAGKWIINVLVLRQCVQFLKCFGQMEVKYVMPNVFYLLKLNSMSCS